MAGIFVSHTHSDKPIADALAELIKTLFGEEVVVSYSSKKELDGGIRPGEDWFHWIVEQVRQTEIAIVLLTPGSIQKPWLLWEAGAVAGAAYATSADKARVYPLTFGIRASDVPTPFANTQTVNGTDKADVLKLTSDLLDRFQKGMPVTKLVRFGANQEAATQKFVGQVSAALLRLPHVVTEAAIQEWLLRLDELRAASRYSEAKVIENWLDVAFGRDDNDKLRPLDVRIHHRLGEIYAMAGQPSDAIRQYGLARQLSPRDIYMLRRLGKAHLDQGDTAGAAEVINEIKTLDSRAFETNAENAALYARWCEMNNNFLGARDVLGVAYSNMPTAYYLGDRLGQILVRLGEREKAKQVYAQVIGTIRDLQEQNVWTTATLLSAAIVRDDAEAEASALNALREIRPSREQLQSIERGLRSVASGIGDGKHALTVLQGIAAGS